VTRRISLALAIHNHQPVGNFGWVFEDVYQHAYRPMVEALGRHPEVVLSLHYTGPLLDWLQEAHPEFLADLRALTARGQVEMLGGGYYEPVLASLPERDRIGQLALMADEVERLFGTRPRGAWLAERVWEPDLPYYLAESGYDWTILDDNHFRGASIKEEDMWGAYITENQGRLLRIFGTEQGLRYRIPFGQPEDVIEYLRDHASEDGKRVGMMGDDGEKFGAWPGTYEHCWTRTGWVDRFFDLLEANGDWLTTVTPTAWLEREPPIGRIYVPTASYIEMGEWALPADEANVFTSLVKESFAGSLPQKRYLRGGFWRNFQVRYREINDLHKQMLRVSAKVTAMPAGPEKDSAVDHLYRGQSNDCYWHGLFGGIYIVHMRLATFAHLIAAEDIADAWARDALAGHDGGPETIPGRAEELPTRPDGAQLVDTDQDGIDEAYLATPGQVVVVDLAEGAGIGSWDLRATRLALAAVMRRRPEAYHPTLIDHERRAADTHEGGPDEGGDAPKTIHDIVMTKEAGLSDRIVYDRHERRGGLVHLVPRWTSAAEFASVAFDELGDFVDAPYRVLGLSDRELIVERNGTILGDGREQAAAVRKTIRLGGGRLDPFLSFEVAVENRGDARLELDLVVEWTFDLAGGGANPAAYYLLPNGAGGEDRLPHDSSGERDGLSSLRFGNEAEGVDVLATFSSPADVAWFSVETVSNSEAGFERSYQGSALLSRWPLDLAPNGHRTVGIHLEARSSRDRLREELGA
jgi:hypothetical protein